MKNSIFGTPWNTDKILIFDQFDMSEYRIAKKDFIGWDGYKDCQFVKEFHSFLGLDLDIFIRHFFSIPPPASFPLSLSKCSYLFESACSISWGCRMITKDKNEEKQFRSFEESGTGNNLSSEIFHVTVVDIAWYVTTLTWLKTK